MKMFTLMMIRQADSRFVGDFYNIRLSFVGSLLWANLKSVVVHFPVWSIASDVKRHRATYDDINFNFHIFGLCVKAKAQGRALSRRETFYYGRVSPTHICSGVERRELFACSLNTIMPLPSTESLMLGITKLIRPEKRDLRWTCLFQVDAFPTPIVPP